MASVTLRSGKRVRRSSAWGAIGMSLTVVVACTARASDRPPDHLDISATPTVAPLVPRVVNANAFATRTPIRHVVFVVKENRTFDDLFGTFPGANGVSFGMDHGRRRPLIRGTDGRLPSDIPHCYQCAIQAWDQGKMDGFDQPPTGNWAYSQLHRSQLPNYWQWAQRNVLFDDFFSSAWGPSFPNHLYTIAAQSGGARDNPRRPPKSMSNTFGCDAPPQQKVQVYDSEGNVVLVPPCFDFRTEGDLLNEAHVPWAYYAAPPTPWKPAQPPRLISTPPESSAAAAKKPVRTIGGERDTGQFLPDTVLLARVGDRMIASTTWVVQFSPWQNE